MFHLHIQRYEKSRHHIEGGDYHDQLNHVPIAGQRFAERRKGSIADANIASHLQGDPNRRAFVGAKLTPPMGLNLFAIQAIADDQSLGDVAKASMPYALMISAFAFLLYAYPVIALWLPAMMKAG